MFSGDTLAAATAGLGLLGLLAYGLSYFYARSFYLEFGLSPRDVGYAPDDVLPSIAWFSLLYVLVGLYSLLLVGPAIAAARRLGWIRRALVRLAAMARRPLSRLFATLALVLTTVAGLQYLDQEAGAQAEAVQNDRVADLIMRSPLTRAGSLPFPGASIRFGVATWVTPADKERTAVVSVLGTHESQVIFWDHCSRVVRHVSAESVTLRARGLQDVDDALIHRTDAALTPPEQHLRHVKGLFCEQVGAEAEALVP